MQIVPGELHVLGTAFGDVIFQMAKGHAVVKLSDLPEQYREVEPGDMVPGYIFPDGSYHIHSEG